MEKVIFITGVSSGFGLAMAKMLVEKGYTIYGSTRRQTHALPGIHYVTMDVTNDRSVKEAVAEIYQSAGRIDVLINNAGMGIAGPLELCTAEDAMRQMDVNFLGMHRVTKEVLPYMRAQNSGRIVCISSIAGLMGIPFQGMYSASKFAIEGYCQSLRLELKSHHIDVVVVNPGDFATGFTANRKIIDTAEVQQAYPKFQNTLQIIEKEEKNGLNPDVLARKIVSIIDKKNPAFSYTIANPVQKLSVFIKHILPKRWFAALLRDYYKV